MSSPFVELIVSIPPPALSSVDVVDAEAKLADSDIVSHPRAVGGCRGWRHFSRFK
jgi:hypothetical protein